MIPGHTCSCRGVAEMLTDGTLKENACCSWLPPALDSKGAAAVSCTLGMARNGASELWPAGALPRSNTATWSMRWLAVATASGCRCAASAANAETTAVGFGASGCTDSCMIKAQKLSQDI